MSTDTNSAEPSSVDDGIRSMCCSSKEKLMDCIHEWEDCVKQHPVKSVLAAAAAGALIHRLPIRSILVANVKIIGALLPPALFAYGAAKVCEILQRKGAAHSGQNALSPTDIAAHPRESRY